MKQRFERKYFTIRTIFPDGRRFFTGTVRISSDNIYDLQCQYVCVYVTGFQFSRSYDTELDERCHGMLRCLDQTFVTVTKWFFVSPVRRWDSLDEKESKQADPWVDLSNQGEPRMGMSQVINRIW
jgi:hypothetical protein